MALKASTSSFGCVVLASSLHNCSLGSSVEVGCPVILWRHGFTLKFPWVRNHVGSFRICICLVQVGVYECGITAGVSHLVCFLVMVWLSLSSCGAHHLITGTECVLSLCLFVRDGLGFDRECRWCWTSQCALICCIFVARMQIKKASRRKWPHMKKAHVVISDPHIVS